jgi:hypothetical protein
MNTYNIQWTKAITNQLSSERYAHFFAIELNGELVFLGKAYHEDLPTLIPACIAHLDLDHSAPNVYLGRIREIGLGRISDASVDAMLGMLVFARKPRLNRVGKYRYQGTLKIDLTNVGLELLPAKLQADNNVVIVGAQPAINAHAPILAC